MNVADILTSTGIMAVIFGLLSYIFKISMKNMSEKIGTNEKRLNAHANDIDSIKDDAGKCKTDIATKFGEIKETIAGLPKIIIDELKKNGYTKR